MEMESIEDFTTRATEWVDANLPSIDDPALPDRELQALIFDGGFAGLAFPAEYGGGGLTLEHHKVFHDVCDRLRRQVRNSCRISIATIGPTLLEHASHEFKQKFLPGLLRGDQVWVQLLSEPQGGSDMAGAVTKLSRHGNGYVLNGAKMWSTGAHAADWAICLARSNWDVPKHAGLSMIALPLKDTPGLTLHQTRKANGELGDFCEEFFDDVQLPGEYLIGEEGEGWTVARTLLLHERYFHGNVQYGYAGAREWSSSAFYGVVHTPQELVAIAERRGVIDQLGTTLADTYIDTVIGPLTERRINAGLRSGSHEGPWGSVLKLQWSVGNHDAVRAELAVMGAEGAVWDGTEVEINNIGTTWIFSRARRIAGGSSEMQRNTISERLLNLPRDPAPDQGKPFKEVKSNRA